MNVPTRLLELVMCHIQHMIRRRYAVLYLLLCEIKMESLLVRFTTQEKKGYHNQQLLPWKMIKQLLELMWEPILMELWQASNCLYYRMSWTMKKKNSLSFETGLRDMNFLGLCLLKAIFRPQKNTNSSENHLFLASKEDTESEVFTNDTQHKYTHLVSF